MFRPQMAYLQALGSVQTRERLPSQQPKRSTTSSFSHGLLSLRHVNKLPIPAWIQDGRTHKEHLLLVYWLRLRSRKQRSDLVHKITYVKENMNYHFTLPPLIIFILHNWQKEEEDFPEVPIEEKISMPHTIWLTCKHSILSKNMWMISWIMQLFIFQPLILF